MAYIIFSHTRCWRPTLYSCVHACAPVLLFFFLSGICAPCSSLSLYVFCMLFSAFFFFFFYCMHTFFPSKHMRAGPAVAPLLFSFLLLPLGSSLLFIFLSTFIFNVVSNYFIDNFSSARKMYSFFILFPILSFCNCSIVSI